AAAGRRADARLSDDAGAKPSLEGGDHRAPVRRTVAPRGRRAPGRLRRDRLDDGPRRVRAVANPFGLALPRGTADRDRALRGWGSTAADRFSPPTLPPPPRLGGEGIRRSYRLRPPPPPPYEPARLPVFQLLGVRDAPPLDWKLL